MSDSDEEIVVSTRNTKCSKLLDSDEDNSGTEDVDAHINEVESISLHAGSKSGENDNFVISEKSVLSDDEHAVPEKIKTAKPFDSDDDSSHKEETNENTENQDWTLEVPVDGKPDTSDVNTAGQEEPLKKPKRYQLLSDDDLSDHSDSVNPVPECKTSSDDSRSSQKSSNSANSNGSSSLSKKERRKKKLQKLNELKRKEIESNQRRSSSSSASDSEDESKRTSSSMPPFKSGKQKKAKRKRNERDNESGRSSASSGSENESKLISNEVSANKKPKSAKQKSKKADPMLEIRSKTQKMIREGRIALPYHQPKQRSLDEFLQRRRNILSIPLRPSIASLNLVGEYLSKKEVEVAEFYKSDSDHESPSEDQVEEPHGSENNETIVPSSTPDFVDTESCNLGTNVDATTDANVSASAALELAVSPLETVGNVEDSEMIKGTSDSCTGTENTTLIGLCDRETISLNDQRSEESTTRSNHSNLENPDEFDQRLSQTAGRVDSENACAVPEKNLNDEADPVADLCLDSDINLAIDNPDPVDNAAEKCVEATPEDIIESETFADNVEPSEKNPPAKTNSPSMHSPESAESAEAEVTAIPEMAADETCPPDSEDFQLVLQDSCSVHDSQCSEAANTAPPSTENAEPVKSADVARSRKLALLSKYNVDLSGDVKLDSGSDSLLQFEVGVANPGVYELMQKFAKHVSAPSRQQKKPTKLSVISTQTDSQGEVVDVVKEVLTLNPTDEEDDYSENKFVLPGSKHTYFKDAMLKKLVCKKEANWNKYQTEKRRYTSADFDEDEFESEDPGGRKLHFEPYHPEDEPDDEDLIEDDVDLTDREKEKNEYLDEEADVSFDEEENIDKEDDLADAASNDDSYDEDEDGSEENEEDEPSEGDVNNDIESDHADISSCPRDEFEEPGAKFTEKLFKYEISGAALENKLLGLESISSQNAEQTQGISNSEVYSLCSGKFVTQPMQSELADAGYSQFLTESQLCDDSQNFNLSMQDTNQDVCSTERDKPTSYKKNLLVSDDESDAEELFKRKTKALRIQDSDDESESPDTPDTIDEAEENSSDDGDGVEDDVDAIGYNSEEEIVDYKGTAAKDFFENEAELSESEWGSEDENEKDLDVLEQEAGDAEDIDNDKLKEELGKIHMRRMLDDDQKEVRLLQEMLLEDGELHSNTNRQRKFQWKNLDGDDFFLKGLDDSDDDTALNEDNEAEQEENWRKIRHEREMFLSQQEKRSENSYVNLEEQEGNLLQVASTTKVSVESTSIVREPLVNPSKSPNPKLSFNAKFKCGSFLSRGKMLLSRIAVTVGESKENIQGRAKNSRNFVFAAVSPEREAAESNVEKTEKRKIASKSVMAAKKLKLSTDNDSSARKPTGLLAQLALSE